MGSTHLVAIHCFDIQLEDTNKERMEIWKSNYDEIEVWTCERQIQSPAPRPLSHANLRVEKQKNLGSNSYFLG